ncbi:hypothetical protein ABOM_006160 [Aspergillus bombycis]|uniref:Uncharacterized protein n=1 Tax=Aspergillus bombycis TaxID=109264 RepID=A0A1F7ZZB6_9EURO|nr:hypothetical protein ABOM_006160 [Aspergillus bombycis]OGM44813.1 hypothetical protein ABOM_006160 [Aspergillus bombycis]
MAIAVRFVRPTIRHFSVRRPQPDTRTSRFVTTSCLFSAVVLPFVPPALESSRAKNTDGSNCNKPHPPLCFHAR